IRPERFRAEDLARFLKRPRVATLSELKQVLGTPVDSTVFRKLAELPYRTSYSHRGRYYTLDDVARFDDLGLWCFRSAWSATDAWRDRRCSAAPSTFPPTRRPASGSGRLARSTRPSPRPWGSVRECGGSRRS